MHRCGQRLYERRLVVGKDLGDLVQPCRRDREDVGHATFSVPAAEELQVLTEVLHLVQAGLAVPTRKGRLDRDPVPDLNGVHAVGDSDHDTDHLMAGVIGGFHESVLAVDAGLVRTTHSRYRHLDQRFAGLESRYGLGDHFDCVVAADNDASAGRCFGHGISCGC